ncbi:MAG: alpha-amylase family glycosyl hydrolase [bacterium]|nr:alpha-amylase family glycosyl hydrolase [bacterium]
MDHIFGTFATDSLKVTHHRLSHRGVQHGGIIDPLDPQPGQAVCVRVRVGAETGIDQGAVYFTTDGSLPSGNRGRAHHGDVVRLERIGQEWDSLLWSYIAIWEGMIPPQSDDTTVRYIVSGWAEGEPEVFADYPDVQRGIEQAAAAHFAGRSLDEVPPYGDPLAAKVFSYRVDSIRTPDWARDSVIYHVFVDRFHPGKGKEWLQTADLNGFVGGTLWGVRDQLDYIADLGATALWLSPTWVAPSHHGYDVADYQQTAPRYGGDEALRAVIRAAHERGLRVILDLVCNHISNENPVFLEAQANADSPKRGWFTFDDSDVGYRSFFGVKSMPQVNLDHPGARTWMIDTARYWMHEFDVDGYRLDYANGPSLDFWTDFRAAVHAERSDAFIFGEVVDAPSAIRGYVGHLDGCLDFFTSETLRRAYGWKSITAAEADRLLSQHLRYVPHDFLMPTFLDNHDMDRFLLVSGGDKDALRRAAAAQMRLPAPPVIYYGTEVGLSQRQSVKGVGLHLSREPMLWGDAQDRELLADYQRLIRARRSG